MATADLTDDGRLDLMQGSLRNLLSWTQKAADRNHGDFTEVSPARVQWSAQTGPLGADLQQAFQTGMVAWHAIWDQGHGLADLIGSRRTYAAMTVARALAEGAARSWDMLEPGVAPVQRVERLFNERLYADEEDRRLLEGLLADLDSSSTAGDAAPERRAAIAARLADGRKVREDLRARATGYGLFPHTSGRGTPKVGQGRAGTMSVLERMLGDELPAGSFFRMISAVAHTVLHGQVRMIRMTQAAGDASISVPVQMHPDDLADQVGPAVLATACAALTLFEQAGWAAKSLRLHVRVVRDAWAPSGRDREGRRFDALS